MMNIHFFFSFHIDLTFSFTVAPLSLERKINSFLASLGAKKSVRIERPFLVYGQHIFIFILHIDACLASTFFLMMLRLCKLLSYHSHGNSNGNYSSISRAKARRVC
jgi:hypothetical protein